MQLGDGAEIDGEGEFDLLALAQAKAGSPDEDAVAERLTALQSERRPSGVMM